MNYFRQKLPHSGKKLHPQKILQFLRCVLQKALHGLTSKRISIAVWSVSIIFYICFSRGSVYDSKLSKSFLNDIWIMQVIHEIPQFFTKKQ